MKKLVLLLAAATLAIAAPSASAQSGKYVVVVNPKNPIKRLDASQLSRIYLGKLQGWEIDGKVEPLVVFDQ